MVSKIQDKPVVKLFWKTWKFMGYIITSSEGVIIGAGIELIVGAFHPNARYHGECKDCGNECYAEIPEGLGAPKVSLCPDCKPVPAK